MPPTWTELLPGKPGGSSFFLPSASRRVLLGLRDHGGHRDLRGDGHRCLDQARTCPPVPVKKSHDRDRVGVTGQERVGGLVRH